MCYVIITLSLQSFDLYKHRDSNRLIEEFMLLANMSVAKKIKEAFPWLAVLRRHPPPKGPMMQKLVDMLGRLGKLLGVLKGGILKARFCK